MSAPFHDTDFAWTGEGLVRPECVICLENGRMVVSNFDGGYSVIEADGDVWHCIAKGDFRPQTNGLCLMSDGSVLLTHLGPETGGVFQLWPDGTLEPFLTHLDGTPIPPTNFVHADALGRVWITVSTRLVPRARAYTPHVADGFVILVDGGDARIVADNLGFTNECLVSPDGRHLAANETYAKRVAIFDIAKNGDLTLSRTITGFEAGEFPDGIAFDEEGHIWIACVVGNRILRLSPDGRQRQVVLDGRDQGHADMVERKCAAQTLRAEDLQWSNGSYGNISSLAFGGPDRTRVFVGNLLGDRIPYFDQSVVGAKPVHWHHAGPARP